MDYGFHTNSEIPAISLVVIGLWLMLRYGETVWAGPLVGLSLSLAVLIRTNLAFVAAAVGCLYLLAIFVPRLRLHRAALFGYVLVGMVPPAVLYCVYAANGATSELMLAVIAVPLSYATNELSIWQVGAETLTKIVQNLQVKPLVFGAFLLLCAAGYTRKIVRETPISAGFEHSARDLLLLMVVFGAVVFSVLRGGSSYGHYVLQFYPFAAVGVACALQKGYFPWRHVSLMPITLVAIATTLWVQLPFSQVVLFHYPEIEAHYPILQAANAIRADWQPADQVWAMEKQLISFYLDRPSITRADTFPSNIIRSSISDVLIQAGYMPDDPLGKIYAMKPRYIVLGATAHPYVKGMQRWRFEAFLKQNYALWLRNDEVSVFRALAS